MSFVSELKWRGMIHDITPGAEEQLDKEMTAGYIGFDPTADSLGIGNLVQVMILLHFQRAGHKPVILVGGATGMVGDPSGKSDERNLLDADTLNKNLEGQKKQLQKFLDFDCGENSAVIVNNYDWFKEFNFLDFIRDVGKHISVNYMMAKDSVKNRLDTGMSFTEFSYQLVQGYDYYHLNKELNCKIQMGGSDQWGNILTGTELIRRKGGSDAYALTTPLITKADGTKFGKTAGGNLWLDKNRTSPYKFYQYWLNSSDEDVKTYMRIFSIKTEEEVLALEKEHAEAPHLRLMQKELGKEITIRVHSEEDYNTAILASNILFGKSTSDELQQMDEKTFLDVFEGVSQSEVARSVIDSGVLIEEILSNHSGFLASKSEAKRALKENSISVNKEKVSDTKEVTIEDLINDKYLLLQRGKKNYFLVKVN